jgi:hypothetical protein
LILETDARTSGSQAVCSSGTGYESPAFAQLVLDPAHPPVRWAEDGRFGFVTDGGVGIIRIARGRRRARARPSRSPLPDMGPHRLADGGEPAAAGLDRRGRIVALT